MPKDTVQMMSGGEIGGPAGGEGVLHLVPSSEWLSGLGGLQPQTAGSSQHWGDLCNDKAQPRSYF